MEFVPTINITYKGFKITEEGDFGSPWKVTDHEGNALEIENEATLEEVKSTIDWFIKQGEMEYQERHPSAYRLEKEFDRREYLADEE
jgi:hypothetical protein